VVLETGGPVLTPWADDVRAVLQAWYPGAEGGTAIARVLFGDVDPGGRLPVTFPARADDLATFGRPERYRGVGEDAHYSEGVFVGDRHFDEEGIDPLFPFGHGLSYASREYSDLRVAPAAGGRIGARVTATVRNTSARDGVEVPQLYVSLPSPGPTVRQPPRALKAFAKLALGPGESRPPASRQGSVDVPRRGDAAAGQLRRPRAGHRRRRGGGAPRRRLQPPCVWSGLTRIWE
jgi:beta-glucosidase